ncbi:phiSA1p31-related protein [Streptomyces cyaneofuscatus]
MAEAQYETRTRTVEETVVVLTLTEGEADELRTLIGQSSATPDRVALLNALTRPSQPAPAAETFEYDGVTYELGATYRDRDGDKWHFARFDDEVVGNTYEVPNSLADGSSLAFVMSYGPLTKITP